jgi:hemerythrin-like domain-containing protein
MGAAQDGALKEKSVQTTETLRAEHTGVLVVLDQLERAVGAAERGAKVPPDIFQDIREFFVVFVDQCHHSKEEAELFPRLEAHGAGAIASRLEQEHTAGRRLSAAYTEAVGAYTPGDGVSSASLASAARAYANFLRAHIDLETRELFPAIEDQLASYDATLTEAFERIEVERIGAGTHERLHGMIEGLARRIEPYALKPVA